jgi:SAM-dependent methyltransferase
VDPGGDSGSRDADLANLARMSKRSIDERAVGDRYAAWFTRGRLAGVMRFLFSPRGLWVINTPHRRILEAAQISNEDRVLDLGCGIGNLLIPLVRAHSFQSKPVGVDVSPEVLELARAATSRAGLSDRIDFTVAPATALPFPARRFSVVISSHMVKHLDEAALDSAFKEVGRVLEPGGRFLLWEFKPSRRSAPIFWSARASGIPPPFILRGAEQLETALRKAGFRDVRQLKTGLFLMPPAPRLALLAVR